MAVTQLASATDVVAALGRDLTSVEVTRVEPILDKASEMFRRRSGQQFTTGTSTVRLKVNGGRVYLPQRPVTSVTGVVDDDAVTIPYTRADQWLDVNILITGTSTYSSFLGSDAFVTVTYAHGGTVPDLVRLAVADIARRVLSVPESALAGMSQYAETKGPFTESGTFAAWAVGGQTMLSPDDKALADSYKFRAPSVTVMRSA